MLLVAEGVEGWASTHQPDYSRQRRNGIARSPEASMKSAEAAALSLKRELVSEGLTS
jgi:hypothetical protein